MQQSSRDQQDGRFAALEVARYHDLEDARACTSLAKWAVAGLG